MWGVFELDRDAWRRQAQALQPSSDQKANVKRLLHMLGQTQADQSQGLEEYERGFKVAHMWATKHNSSDRDAWARVAAIPRFRKLKRVICIMLGFLLTETECERTFAEERVVHSGRPRMDPDTRFECLKVKTDGLPFCELQEDGKPVNDFWRCCQDAYAKRFGKRRLCDVKRRSDYGTHRETEYKRDGKNTVTSFKRKRQEVLHRAQEACPRACSDVTKNVFGYRPVEASKLQEIREQEESAAFRDLMVKMEKRFNEKREETNRVLAAAPGSLALCDLPAKKRRKVEREHQKRRRIIENFGFTGLREVSCRSLFHSLGGSPLVFVMPDATGSLAGRGMDEIFQKRSLRSYTFKGSLAEYTRSLECRFRRIILVPCLATLPMEVRLVAAFVGARLQEQLLVPAVKFRALGAHTFAFSGDFLQKHKRLVPIIRAAAARPVVGQAKVSVLKKRAFLAEVRKKAEKGGHAWKKTMTFLYSNADDAETKSLSEAEAQVARSIEEFLQSCCSME